MSLIISVESTEIESKTSKADKTYYTQTAYAHTVNRDGTPKRYPEQINLFPKKNPDGQPVPYPKGDYTLGEGSFQVQRGFLEMNFPELVQAKK